MPTNEFFFEICIAVSNLIPSIQKLSRCLKCKCLLPLAILMQSFTNQCSSDGEEEKVEDWIQSNRLNRPRLNPSRLPPR